MFVFFSGHVRFLMLLIPSRRAVSVGVGWGPGVRRHSEKAGGLSYNLRMEKKVRETCTPARGGHPCVEAWCSGCWRKPSCASSLPHPGLCLTGHLTPSTCTFIHTRDSVSSCTALLKSTWSLGPPAAWGWLHVLPYPLSPRPSGTDGHTPFSWAMKHKGISSLSLASERDLCLNRRAVTYRPSGKPLWMLSFLRGGTVWVANNRGYNWMLHIFAKDWKGPWWYNSQINTQSVIFW